MNNEFNDDRDVKIFSGDSSDNNAPEDSEYVRLINEKKGSRNIRRAMQLGASLVMEIDRCIPDLNSGVMALSDDLDPMLLHRSMLLVFSIIIGMEQYIPGKALVGTALNVL